MATGRATSRSSPGWRASTRRIDTAGPLRGKRLRRPGSAKRTRLQLAQPYSSYGVIAPFLEDEMGAVARGQHVLAQIHEIDRLPQAAGRRPAFLRRQVRVAVKIRRGVAEHRVAQRHEPLDVPLLDVGLVRVDVNRKIEKV